MTRAPDGSWLMFYTGCTPNGPGLKQRVGLATSAELYSWHKHPASPVLESDGRWYVPGLVRWTADRASLVADATAAW